jgi:hypothetical protein
MVGVDPVRYAMFVRSTPTLQWSVSGKHTTIMTRSHDNVSQGEFSDLVDFLIDYAVKANDAYILAWTMPIILAGVYRRSYEVRGADLSVPYGWVPNLDSWPFAECDNAPYGRTALPLL